MMIDQAARTNPTIFQAPCFSLFVAGVDMISMLGREERADLSHSESAETGPACLEKCGTHC